MKFLEKNVGIQDLLIELGEEVLQTSGHVKIRMNETKIKGGELELKFKRKRSMGLCRTRCFSQGL